MIRVRIPSPLHSYTAGAAETSLDAPTLAAMADRLDERYPGIRFRIIDEHGNIRRHIQLFVNDELARDLAAALSPGDTVHIICALSGG